MAPGEYARMAGRALSAHLLRSTLTVSSVTLGAFSIVLMSSLATAGLETLLKDIESLGGARILLVAPKRPERAVGRRTAPITMADRDHLAAHVPHVEAMTAYATLEPTRVAHGEKEASTDLVVGDAGFFATLSLVVAEGRPFTEAENKTHARVCVVADKVAKRLFDGHAVGQWLELGGRHYLVVGQLGPVDHWGTNFGFDWVDHVAIPIETWADVNPKVRGEIFLQLRTTDAAHNDLAKRVVNAIFTERHHGVDDFQIWDFSRFMNKFYAMFAIMETLVGLVASIALVVGGVGIMNIMSVSVSERVREIGIRKALGASPTAIGTQFLWESSLLSGAGGLLGVVLGAASAVGANLLIQSVRSSWVNTVSVPAMVVALVVSLAVGIGFGYWPARTASKLDPVEAMRS